MVSRNLPALCIALCSAALLAPLPAQANTLLTKATLKRVQNKVDLTKNNSVQPAKPADTMVPGNILQTYQSALADLKFNDNSMARIGQRAVFRFQPNTRSFDLKSGTALFLIRPGQGTTRVRTPNATAGIRGSALFVRYISANQSTMIGALTNSDIEVVVPNCGASRAQAVDNLETEADESSSNCPKVVLKAGQMAVVYQGQLSVYPFDQRYFQETSPFFKDIDWNEAPVAVKAEIDAALAGQPAFSKVAQENPVWLTAESQPPTPMPVIQPNPAQPLVPAGVDSVSPVDRPVTGGFPTGTPAIANPQPGPGVQPPTIITPPAAGPGPAPGPVAPVPGLPAPGPIAQPGVRPQPSVPIVQPPTRPEPSVLGPVAPPPVAPVTPVAPPSPIVPPSAPVAAPPPRPEPIVIPPSPPVVAPPVVAPPVVAPPITPVVSPPSPPVVAPPVATPPVAPPASPVINNTPAAPGGGLPGAVTAPLDPPAVQIGPAPAPGPSPNASPAADGTVVPPGTPDPRPVPNVP